jgi:hypothetical protein
MARRCSAARYPVASRGRQPVAGAAPVYRPCKFGHHRPRCGQGQMWPVGHGFPSCSCPTAQRVETMIAISIRRMTIIHRLLNAITRVDGGRHEAIRDLKQCSPCYSGSRKCSFGSTKAEGLKRSAAALRRKVLNAVAYGTLERITASTILPSTADWIST